MDSTSDLSILNLSAVFFDGNTDSRYQQVVIPAA